MGRKKQENEGYISMKRKLGDTSSEVSNLYGNDGLGGLGEQVQLSSALVLGQSTGFSEV